MKRKLIYFVLAVMLLSLIFVLTGCTSKEKSVKNNTNTTSSKTNTSNSSSKNTTKNESNNDISSINFEEAAEKQMAMPEEGDTIAIIHVRDFGDITVRFFEDVAPKAVENFVEHSKNGYYDGIKFHRVIDEFMIQGGDPLGTGRGGESIWGKGFSEELDYSIVPYRGSLCMASAGTGTSTIGSQFFITQANYSETMAERLKSAGYPEGMINMYKKYGGYLSLYLGYTVFGQVIDGMDVVDSIAAVETQVTEGSTEKSTPVEDVIIDTIEVTTYSK